MSGRKKVVKEGYWICSSKEIDSHGAVYFSQWFDNFGFLTDLQVQAKTYTREELKDDEKDTSLEIPIIYKHPQKPSYKGRYKKLRVTIEVIPFRCKK